MPRKYTHIKQYKVAGVAVPVCSLTIALQGGFFVQSE